MRLKRAVDSALLGQQSWINTNCGSTGGARSMFGRLLLRGVALGLIGLSLSSATVMAGGATVPAPSATADLTTVRVTKIPVPGNPLKSFDIGWVDAATQHYYLADRSNAAIDVVNTQTNEVTAQIPGFVGFKGSNDTAGPDGVVVTFSGRELWAGDGDSTVKVIDLKKNAIVDSISTGGKNRADELAYDPKDNLIVIANDADDPPYLSLISVGTHQVMKKIDFEDATDGLEQPIYDSQTGMIFQAVPSSTQNDGGQIAVIDPAKMEVVKRYNLNSCVPHGMALGPGNQLLAGCSLPNRNAIIDKTNGTLITGFSQTGGGDESWFNPGDHRYYSAATGTMSLGIIDADDFSLTLNVATGAGAHSVAADPISNHIFVPIAGPDKACPDGCIAVFTGVTTENASMGTAP
jgi:DNA-binding beta-propeller fold protein YncE